MSIFDRIKQGLLIYAQLEAAKESIVAAPVGGSVDAGVAKGIRVFGRVIDLPLQPIIRK